MKQIFATIIKFLLSVFFFLSAILVTSFLDAQKSVYFENSISSELLAKRDIGIELPFPEIEKNIFNKPEKDESGAIVNLLPNDIQNKNIIEKENSDIQPKKHHKKNEQIKKELNPLKSRTQSKEEISKKEKTKEPKIQSKEKEVVVKIEKATKPTEIKKSIEKKEDLKIEKSAEEKQNESLSKKEEEPIIKIKKEEKEKKFPENLPKYIQGIYITNQTLFDKEKFSEIRKKVKLFGINTLVIDVQPKAIPKKILDDIHKDKIYTIARVVNFDGGLKTEQPSQKKKDALKSAVVFACESGFQEIQFDYIRYSDTNHKGLNIGKKYLNIEKFIEELKTAGRGCNKDLLFGADIFGRIPFVKHDRIGQNLERF
ncbi:MAG: hypothetical protein HUU45_01445 [Leptospiraceae bacterium]|nr:hypothetical protein [Leptospiraceae bacterium]